jgi:hypothetical protein
MCKSFRHRGMGGPKLLLWSEGCKGHHAPTRYEEPVTTKTGRGVQGDEVNTPQVSKGVAFVSVPMIVAALLLAGNGGRKIARAENERRSNGHGLVPSE